MGLGDSFANRKTNRLKEMLPVKVEHNSNFDYSEISEEDKEDLLNLESLVINKKNEIINQVIELGDISKLETKKSLSAANVLHPSSLLRS